MNEFSNFHYHGGDRNTYAEVQPGTEIIRNKAEYRGFILRRGNPSAGYMWNIFDSNDKEVLGLGGSFTKLQIAEAAIDQWIANKQLELGERVFEQTTIKENQASD